MARIPSKNGLYTKKCCLEMEVNRFSLQLGKSSSFTPPLPQVPAYLTGGERAQHYALSTSPLATTAQSGWKGTAPNLLVFTPPKSTCSQLGPGCSPSPRCSGVLSPNRWPRNLSYPKSVTAFHIFILSNLQYF